MDDVTGLPSTGDPPPGMAHRLRRQQGLPSPPVELMSGAPAGDVVSPAPAALVPRSKGERIRLHYTPPNFPGFVLDFHGAVNVKEFYIAIILTSDVRFEFSDMVLDHLDIEYRKVRYPVKWVGGIFEFTDPGLNCISFMRDKNRTSQESHDQDQQGSSR